ncbi:MAG: penicillin-binding protein 1C [Pseudomonadota bacterium]
MRTAAALLPVLAAGALWAGVAISKLALGAPVLPAADAVSVTVLDREERLLRAFTTPEGRWRLPVAVDDVDARYLAMLLAFEDKRFWSHGGVDVQALLRAASQLVGEQRIVSGGSTLTMQVARLLDERFERSARSKLAQIVRALQIEERLSKPEILRLYLTLAPFGGNIEGVRAASLAYFGKEPRRLSIGEAALLVALPQSPETRRPDRHPDAARRARTRVLDRAVAAGIVTREEAERARLEPVPTARRPFPMLAPHLAEAEHNAAPATTIHRLTIDRDLQRALEALAEEHARLVGSRLSAAIVVADHLSGEVLARVGSAGYLDDSRFGAVDMAAAVRSPGSTLKPLIYGLSFELGLAHPETLIEDRPTRFGSYRPENFDEAFHGTVSVREALARSLNVPAVKVLEAVGPGRLVGRMQQAGIETRLPQGSEPSLAVALGGIGTTLVDLTELYVALARGGESIRLTHRRLDARPAPGASERKTRLLGAIAAWQVTDILKDAPPPASARGGRIAYKTGTSYGYRDAWAIGYDGRHTVAVWIGRPDAASTPGLMGRSAAAPLLFDSFGRLGERRAPLAPPPRGAGRIAAADLPVPLKRFGADRQAGPEGPYLDPPVAITFPPDRAELEIEASGPDPILLRAAGGALPLTWLVDGAPIGSDPRRREVLWQPAGAGFARLSVIDAKGRSDRVTVRLK